MCWISPRVEVLLTIMWLTYRFLRFCLWFSFQYLPIMYHGNFTLYSEVHICSKTIICVCFSFLYTTVRSSSLSLAFSKFVVVKLCTAFASFYCMCFCFKSWFGNFMHFASFLFYCCHHFEYLKMNCGLFLWVNLNFGLCCGHGVYVSHKS